MFDKRVLRRLYGSRRDEATREWRRLHNKELNDLYPSPNVIRVSKSRIMRWVEHVARMGRGQVFTGFWWGNLRVTDHLEDPGLDGWLIFK